MITVARTDSAGDVTRKLLGRLDRRVRKRAQAVVVREVRNAGIAVGRQFLRGLLPGGPVTGFAIDFLASEIRREISPSKIAKMAADAQQQKLNKTLTGFENDLREAEIFDKNRLTRLGNALSDRFLTQVRAKYTPEVANALAPALGNDLANITADELRKRVRTAYLEKAVTADYAEINRYLGQLITDRDTQVKAIQKAGTQAKRLAVDSMLGKVRRQAGNYLADFISDKFKLDRQISSIAATELVAGIRRSNIKEIANIVKGDLPKAKEKMLEDVDTLREQLHEVSGTDPAARQPGETDIEYVERQRTIQADLRDLNAAEGERTKKLLESDGDIKALPPWREEGQFPVDPQYPLGKRATEAQTLVLEPGSETLITPAPKRIAGQLPSGFLKDPANMTRKELQAEMVSLRAKGLPVPRRMIRTSKMREAVANFRYMAYPQNLKRWPKELLPDPDSLTFSQLQQQLTALKEAGHGRDYPAAWWANEKKMKTTLGKIRAEQIQRDPKLQRRQSVEQRAGGTVIPGSGSVVELPPARLMLPADAGPSGPVRGIPDPDSLTYNQMQKVVKQMREAGYEVPKQRTKAALSEYLRRAQSEGAFLPGAAPPDYVVRTTVGPGELPFEQRWQRLSRETDADYIARLRGLIAHKTGEIPARAEIEGQKKYLNRLAKTYEGLQGNLRTPMTGWAPIPADKYTPLSKENKWKRIAGEKIGPYTERLDRLFRERRGFGLNQLPEETPTQFMERLKRSVRDLQEQPPRMRAEFSNPSQLINGSKRRYVYDPNRRLYLDVRTGQYRERFIFDAGMGQYRDLSSGKLVSARRIRDILRQSGDRAEEIMATLNRALLNSDRSGVEFKTSQYEQRRGATTNREKANLLPKTSTVAKQRPRAFEVDVPNPWKDITLADWQEQAVGELRDHYAAQFAAGAGGIDALEQAVDIRAESLNQRIKTSDPEQLQQEMQQNRQQAQQEVLRPLEQMTQAEMTRFKAMTELVEKGALTAAEMMLRSILYAKAGKIAYNLGVQLQQKIRGNNEERRVLGDVEHCPDCIAYAKMDWQPIGTLPMPGEKSVCGANCYCRMEYRYTERQDSAASLISNVHTANLRSLLGI